MSYATVPNFIRGRLLAEPKISGKVGERVHYQHIPTSSSYPHIFFTRNGSTSERLLDGPGITEERFIIEVVTTKFDDELITAVIEALEIDSEEVDGIFLALGEVDDMQDDYAFVSVAEGDALCKHAFLLTIYIT